MGHRDSMSTAKPKCIKFSEEEKFLILEEFSLRKDVLIPKRGQCKNTVAQQCAWEEIAAAINSLSPLVRRTPAEIHKKRHNMVIDACRELAVEKHPLLRQRPQEKLFHSIFALFNKPGPGPPDPLLSASASRARAARGPLPPRTLEVTLDLLRHGQSSTAAPGQGLLCPAGTPPVPVPVLESLLAAAGGEPKSKESLLPAGLQASMEKRLMAPGMAPSLPAARCSQQQLLVPPRCRATVQRGWPWCCRPAPPSPPRPSPSSARRPQRWCGRASARWRAQQCGAGGRAAPAPRRPARQPFGAGGVPARALGLRQHGWGAVGEAEPAAGGDPGAAEGDPAAAEGEDPAGEGEAPPGNHQTPQGARHRTVLCRHRGGPGPRSPLWGRGQPAPPGDGCWLPTCSQGATG
ncbi:uncharacterized protein LOC142416371 [Mycteria americana]|uniref:uncharacterized protein LOC142416371 n=1 Tax=Mycteria americana TaxID=33587 RepID=UPI003F589AE4